MVQKLTLFEVHLDDARFGTNEALEAADMADVETPRPEIETHETEIAEPETTDEGPNVRRLVAASLIVSVVATAIARRLFGDDKPAASIEIDGTDKELEAEA